MVDSGPCACGQGEVRFRGSCGPCEWRGKVRHTASEAADDCMNHNRRLRHRPASATYASLALTHTHEGTMIHTPEDTRDTRP